MSKEQIHRLIFRIDARHAMLVALLSVVATAGAAVESVVIEHAAEASKTMSLMDGPQLLALIALASMAFAAWMFYRLTASVQQLAIGLAQLSARLENRPCLLDHERDKSG